MSEVRTLDKSVCGGLQVVWIRGVPGHGACVQRAPNNRISRVGEGAFDQFAENEGTKNTDAHSPKRRRLTRLESPNRHFIEAGDSDPLAHDDESFASDQPSSTQQPKEKSVQLPKIVFGTRLNKQKGSSLVFLVREDPNLCRCVLLYTSGRYRE